MDWDESLKGYEGLILVNAHCDQRVLHEPGLCEYCDEYPEAQAKRVELGVNFTSLNDPNLLPCPADKARPVTNLYSWAGNHPSGPNVPEELKEALESIESPSSKVMYGEFLDE